MFQENTAKTILFCFIILLQFSMLCLTVSWLLLLFLYLKLKNQSIFFLKENTAMTISFLYFFTILDIMSDQNLTVTTFFYFACKAM